VPWEIYESLEIRVEIASLTKRLHTALQLPYSRAFYPELKFT